MERDEGQAKGGYAAGWGERSLLGSQGHRPYRQFGPRRGIVLLVIDGGTERDHLPGLPRESFLHDMYNWLDRRNNQEGTDPLAFMDIPASLDRVGRVYIKRARGAARTVPEDALRRIKERDLDVLFDIGNVTPLGEVSKYSRYGTWSFSPGDGETYDGRPPGFWGDLRRHPGHYLSRPKDQQRLLGSDLSLPFPYCHEIGEKEPRADLPQRYLVHPPIARASIPGG